VKIQPSLPGYLQVQTLAEENWPAWQAEILQHLRTGSWKWRSQEGVVQIFLEEEAIDDAINLVDRDSAISRITQEVMNAAVARRPDWVIAKALSYAEEIMNHSRADRYSDAVSCLKRARSVYQQSGRDADWQQYLAQLLETHGRKRKLIGLIKEAKLS
jgi:uncharacterized Zn finger protein